MDRLSVDYEGAGIRLSRRSSFLLPGSYYIGPEEDEMSHTISDACTMCGSCKEVCPAEAISEGDPNYVIDPETCIDCAACVDECPVGAITGPK